jgi:hypothetical protein
LVSGSGSGSPSGKARWKTAVSVLTLSPIFADPQNQWLHWLASPWDSNLYDA